MESPYGMAWFLIRRKGNSFYAAAVSGRFLNNNSTIVSSANVDVSPTLRSFTAIFLKIRLIIFPDLVFGSAGAC